MSRLSYSAFISKCINSCFSYSALESHYAVTVIFRVLSSVTLRGNGWEGRARHRFALQTILIRLSPKKRRAEKREKQERETSENQFSEQRPMCSPVAQDRRANERGERETEKERMEVLSRCWVERLEGVRWSHCGALRKPRHSGQFIWKLFSLYQVVLWIIEIVGRGHCVKGCSRSLALCLTPPRRWFV